MRDPFDQAAYISPNQGLLGDDGGAGALNKVPLEFVQVGAHNALYTATVEKRPGQHGIAAHRRQDQHTRAECRLTHPCHRRPLESWAAIQHRLEFRT